MAQYVFCPTATGFSVHVKGCPGMGRRGRTAVASNAIEEDVAEARARGHVVTYCACTKYTEADGRSPTSRCDR